MPLPSYRRPARLQDRKSTAVVGTASEGAQAAHHWTAQWRRPPRLVAVVLRSFSIARGRLRYAGKATPGGRHDHRPLHSRSYHHGCRKPLFRMAKQGLSQISGRRVLRVIGHYVLSLSRRCPKDHWIHLRTTNPVESPFSAVRLRTDAARRYKKVANAEALIWKILMIAEKKFRRLNAPELLAAVYDGQLFEDGMPVNETNPKRRAA